VGISIRSITASGERSPLSSRHAGGRSLRSSFHCASRWRIGITGTVLESGNTPSICRLRKNKAWYVLARSSVMLGTREKSKVRSEKGFARRLSCRSPTEMGSELSKARMRARRVFFSLQPLQEEEEQRLEA